MAVTRMIDHRIQVQVTEYTAQNEGPALPRLMQDEARMSEQASWQKHRTGCGRRSPVRTSATLPPDAFASCHDGALVV